MNLRRVVAVARKEALHILRDPRSLGMGVAMPIALLLLFGYALTLDVDRVPLNVWDQSRTPQSRELISRFDGSRYFTIHQYVDHYDEIESAVDRNETLGALVIPAGFAADVERGRTASIQLIVDGSDANSASMAIAYAESIASAHGADLVQKRIRQSGGGTRTLPLELRPRVWYNPDLDSRNYIVPGLIAVIMAVIAALLTSLTVAREWENGTMEQLISTPLRGRELILGKLIPYFGIGLIDVTVAVLMGEFLFHVPLRGSAALLFASASLFLIGALSMGLLISIATRGQLLASQIAMVTTFLPAFLLSGFMFDIANMPKVLQVITHVVAARYFVSLLKGIYLKGSGVAMLAGDLLFLAAFGAVMLVIANHKLQRKLT